MESVRLKFDLLRHVMDERMTRLWAAAEARALGVGGGVIVTRATGIRSKRISQGQHDLGLSGRYFDTEEDHAATATRPRHFPRRVELHHSSWNLFQRSLIYAGALSI